VKASQFVRQIRRQGFDLYVGVPCSFLKPLINYAIDDPQLEYVAANNEGEAVAYAFGAWLAGRKAVVMFQNSGLGNTINPLSSLAIPFQVPLLLVTTWRGEPGLKDEPQHDVMGRATADLLTLLGIVNVVADGQEGGLAGQLADAADHIHACSIPYGLILRKGTVEPYDLQTAGAAAPQRPPCSVLPPQREATEMSRYDCIRVIADLAGEEHVVIATTGKTGRELFTYRDSDNHLYVVGGMGCAGSIGLGLARHIDESRTVIIIDGDGAALMRLEALVSIGHLHPPNLVHVILDNNAHDSTGGQQTLSHTVDFAAVASGVGYRHARSISTLDAFESELRDALTRPGPSLLHARIQLGSLDSLGRPTIPPSAVARRLKTWLATN
jgi:phosphonopyruvate decarboxylase